MQFLVAAALIAVTAVAAAVIGHRRRTDPPTQTRWNVPAQLDPSDFVPGAPWLVVVFTSASCHTCADVNRKAAVLACRDVAVFEADYDTHRVLHERYGIDAVPTVVIADDEGVVRKSFLGPVTATDLWAACAEVRSPGSSPEPDLGGS